MKDNCTDILMDTLYIYVPQNPTKISDISENIRIYPSCPYISVHILTSKISDASHLWKGRKYFDLQCFGLFWLTFYF